MRDQSAQGIQTASDIFALVEKTKVGWKIRADVISDMQNQDMAALASFTEELIAINTAQLKVMGLLLEHFENITFEQDGYPRALVVINPTAQG